VVYWIVVRHIVKYWHLRYDLFKKSNFWTHSRHHQSVVSPQRYCWNSTNRPLYIDFPAL